MAAHRSVIVASLIMSGAGFMDIPKAFAADPVIHVQWDGGGTPELGANYIISTAAPASADYPNVVLITGHPDWRIWSTDSDNPGSVGDLGVISSPYAQNYGVRLLDAQNGAGARHVRGLNLQPTSSANYSNLTGGTIGGNLLGPLTLQKSSGGTGGEASITIWGNVEGDASIPLASELVVYGSVAEDVTIELGDAGSVLIYGDLAGELSFPNGLVGGGKSVDINGALTSTAIIDYHGEELGSYLNLYGGAAEGSQISAGNLTTAIRLGEVYQDFAGALTLDSIGQNGFIEIEVAELTGSIEVLGDWAGMLQMYGNISETATISIGGDFTSQALIAVYGAGSFGNLEGAVAIDGDYSGSLVTWQDITGDISIGGNAVGDFVANITGTHGGDISGDITIDGTFNGNICGDNLSPMEALPGNIDIETFGTSGLICGARPGCGDGTIDESDPADGTHDARQPHPVDNCSPGARQGIGSDEEPIIITLTEGGANNLDCWALCETGIETVIPARAARRSVPTPLPA